MERTNKQKKVIILYFVIFLLGIFATSLLFFYYLLPDIKEIEEIKNSTYETFTKVNAIKNKWISYDEFKSAISAELSSDSAKNWEDGYLVEVANSITEDFYNTYLVNDSNTSYLTFLEEQSAELWEWELNAKRNEIVSKILPVYSEVVSDLWDWSLSEFKFVNYIESIIETFNLTFSNQVWISNVTLLENYSVWVFDSSLETNIYYIPVNLDLTWKRSDILDFLYFAGHVWKVYIEWDELLIDKKVISDFERSFKNKILKWEASNSEIFNNQILDIESANFTEYIDPSITYSANYTTESLVWNIKNTQFSEDWNYKVSVVLRFYVKWLPIYKVEQYITEFIRDFNQVQTKIETLLLNTNIGNNRQKIVNISDKMGQFSKSILISIQKSLASKSAINEWYNLVNTYYPTINEYKNTLEQVEASLNDSVKIWETTQQEVLE